MNNLLKLSAVLLVIMISVGIGFNVYNKSNEIKQKKTDLRLENDKRDKAMQMAVGWCLSQADDNYRTNWNL